MSRIYEECTDAIVYKTKELTKNENLIAAAENVKLQFDQVNEAFSQVHTLVSHCNPVSADEIITIHVNVQRLFPRKNYPKATFPGEALPVMDASIWIWSRPTR